MIEKFCLPDPPPGLRSRILERAAISPTPASATGSAWKVVSIAGAIAVFLAIGALIVLPLRRTSSSGESGTSAKRWLAPLEVLRRSDDMPLPFSRRIFRSPGGKAGLVSYGWNHGPKILLARDHTLPWSELSFVGQDPSEPLLDGEAVSFLFKRGDSIEFLRVDLTRKEASGPTSLPGIADGKWANLQCLALGDELFALVRVPDGRVMFSKSPDKGATWSPLEGIAQTRPGDFSRTARLFLVGQVLHLFYVTASGELRHLQSDDRGIAWKESGTSPIDPVQGMPSQLGGIALEGTLHLVTSRNLVNSRKGLWSHHVSRDGGRTWEHHPIHTDDNEWRGFTLTGRAGVLCLALEGVPALYLSRDGGVTWKPENVFDHLRGELRCASAWIEADGRILAEAEARMPPSSIDPKKIPPGPGFQATGSYGVGYVVLRSYEEPPRLPPPDTRVVHDLLRQLGDDDVARREDAQQKLLGLGEASIPELREALRSTQDVEVRARVDQLFRAYERQWLGQGPIPDWWTPDVRKE